MISQAAIRFIVPGRPMPGGSKRAFKHAKTGNVITMDANPKVKLWRGVVAVAARQAYRRPPMMVPLKLTVVFRFRRPRSHYGTGRNSTQMKASAPPHHIQRPDATKLLRALEDALTGMLWGDDAQIVEQHVSKEWTDGQEQAEVIVAAV